MNPFIDQFNSMNSAVPLGPFEEEFIDHVFSITSIDSQDYFRSNIEMDVAKSIVYSDKYAFTEMMEMHGIPFEQLTEAIKLDPAEYAYNLVFSDNISTASTLLDELLYYRSKGII